MNILIYGEERVFFWLNLGEDMLDRSMYRRRFHFWLRILDFKLQIGTPSMRKYMDETIRDRLRVLITNYRMSISSWIEPNNADIINSIRRR